jgi:peptidoglycan/LPS O-acetylase OafA/YrhL
MHFIGNFYDPCKYFFLSLFAIPFFRYCLQLPPAGTKIKMMWLVIPHTLIVIAAFTFPYMPLTNVIAYSTLPYVYMGFGYLVITSKFKSQALNFINKGGTILGKYSYSLYITHFTVLFVVARLVNNIWIFALVSLPIIAFVAYSLENWLQPLVLKYFKKKKAQPQPAPAREYDLNLNNLREA